MTLSVTPIPLLEDNYGWLLVDEETGAVGLVDPGEVAPCAQAIEAGPKRLDLILITHHHADHTGGVEGLRQRYGSAVIGARADAGRLPALTHALAEGDSVELGSTRGRVLSTPGHTRGHISFFFPDDGVLLCGDTLFSLGCGRLSEGTAADMFESLQKFVRLPGATRVCCGHEYTEQNGRFALTVEPQNARLRERLARARALRAQDKPTVPVALAEELETNPFLRAKSAVEFARLRAAKDVFRAA